MKDILIKEQNVRKEILFWLVSFALSVAVNIIGIIKYNTSWWELITQLHIVFLLSIFIYLIVLLARGLIIIGKKIFVKK